MMRGGVATKLFLYCCLAIVITSAKCKGSFVYRGRNSKTGSTENLLDSSDSGIPGESNLNVKKECGPKFTPEISKTVDDTDACGSAAGGGSLLSKCVEKSKRLSKWLQKHVSNIVTTKCEKAKKRGEVPNASEGHSPLASFGYPVYHEKTNTMFVESRASLSVINHFKVPIQVGKDDYVVAGSLAEVILFLKCFETYEVIGSTMDSDGKWSSTSDEARNNGLYLQIQNTVGVFESPLDLRNLLIRLGAERLLKFGNEIRKFADGGLLNLYNDVVNSAQTVQSYRQSNHSPAMEDLQLLWEAFDQAPTLGKRLELIKKHAQNVIGLLHLKESDGWENRGAVSLSDRICLKFTSYPQPSHGVRATYKMKRNSVLLRDILETLPKLE